MADELGLDVEKENDLISLAQYYKNVNGSRSQINQLIIDSYGGKEISKNHRILARLPISTFWTTNYDSLIEDSLKEIKKSLMSSILMLTYPKQSLKEILSSIKCMETEIIRILQLF